MHSINLDLLRAGATHHSDGRSKDPHARHRAEHLAARRAARLARWQAAIACVSALLAARPAGPDRALELQPRT